MHCNRLADLIPAYLDGSLTGRLNQRVADHLDTCERCRLELSAQQRALRALDAGRHTVNIDLWADFSRRLQEQAPAPVAPWRRAWQPGMAVAAAAVAVAFIAHLSVSPTPGPSSKPTADAPVRIAQSDVLFQPDGSAPGLQSESVSRLGAPHMRWRSDHPTRLKTAFAGGSRHRRTEVSQRNQRAMARMSHTGRPAAPAPHTRPRRSEAHAYQIALAPPFGEAIGQTPAGMVSSAPVDPSVTRRVSAAISSSTQPSSRSEMTGTRSGDPLSVAMALAAVEKDTASSQMGGELLRMAREVARVSGEAGSSDLEPTSSSADLTSGGAADLSHSSGT